MPHLPTRTEHCQRAPKRTLSVDSFSPLCYSVLHRTRRKSSAHSVDSVWQYRLSAWRKHWIRKSSQVSKERAAPSVSEFLAAQLLPWWLQCRQCGQWRQLPPRTPIGNPDSPFRPDTFACRTMAKVVVCLFAQPIVTHATHLLCALTWYC
ncbi:hypothetical protein P879_11186 [Paragonimus westermani]|uniref:CW-type domain-containing protein n=1 Tax=Paragonimus westermani TaxID=34504 RepID=A0A8T0DGK6_9TREM|nr:hypothetical protein P879_11186 [Paragonimus westermani]